MSDILTFIADEIVRATTLIWSGISIAVKLNYSIMSYVVGFSSRLIQLLLLLMQKTVMFFTILFHDTMLFLSDIGTWVISAISAIHWFSLFVKNTCFGLVTLFVAFINNVHEMVVFSSMLALEGFVMVGGQIQYVLEILQNFFLLIGSSLTFAVLFLPNILKLILGSSIHVFSKIQLVLSNFFKRLPDTVHYLSYVFKDKFNFLKHFSLYTTIELVIGILFTLLFIYFMKSIVRYIRPYTESHFYINIAHQFMNIFSQIGQFILNNYGTPLNNQNAPRPNNFDERDASSSGQSVPNLSNNIPGSSNSNQVLNIHSVNTLKRRPLRRSQRMLGLRHDVMEDEVLEDSNGSYELKENNGQKSNSHLEDRDDLSCVVCQDEPKRVILLPCRHLCLCNNCCNSVVERSNRCPICRSNIVDSFLIYL